MPRRSPDRPSRVGATSVSTDAAPTEFEAWRRDLARNRGSAKGRIVLSLYRFGRVLPGGLRRVYKPFYYVAVDMLLGISLPLETRIGPGLLLRHGQGVVLSWRSTLGADCELHQHVTLGEQGEGVPHLGDRVLIGASAVLIGGIRIGDDAVIGAGAVVVRDVPPGATAVGNPARILPTPSADD